MIRDLLDFARARQGAAFPLREAPICNELMRHRSTKLRPSIDSNDSNWRLSPAMDVEVGDPDSQLRQIFQ